MFSTTRRNNGRRDLGEVLCGAAAAAQLLWVQSHCPLLSRISPDVSREVCRFFKREVFLARVFMKDLAIYLSPTELYGFEPIDVSCYPASVLVDSYTLMCFGGVDPPTDEVRSVDLRSFHTTKVSPMSVPRRLPGVVAVGDFVYVIGGSIAEEGWTSCEKFDRVSRKWSLLPVLAERCNYSTPVLYGRDILLVASRNYYTEVVAYNIDTNSFRDYFRIVAYRIRSPFVIVNDTMIFMDFGRAYLWRIGSAEVQTKDESDLCPCLFGEVKAIGTKIYWINIHTMRLESFDTAPLFSRQTRQLP